ncbi:MAG: carboxypeptidase-like regulatory domain-containing protein, partial [Prevotellaceae bacterium]|nr:carboxypeptidase-like regulatory domain-containing protein [Prevotellaceae bacterium]
MRKRKFILVMLCILMSSFAAFAQQKLTGTVVDTSGEPIIGASVIEKGTARGGVTDVNGNFSFSVSEGSILQISYLGYATKEVRVGKQSHLEITLEEDTKTLDEVVVIGYGTIKKADLTGAVSNVGGERLANVQATSISQALQGSMPGVQITRSSSMPGAGATIRV